MKSVFSQGEAFCWAKPTTSLRGIQFLLLAVALAMSASARADVALADKGKSRHRIVVAADAIPSERYAAEELQRYLERLSGVKLPIEEPG